MSLGLDDKLLGEKVHNYCSSSEDEGEEDSDLGDEDEQKPVSKPPTFIPEPQLNNYSGHCTNTGPKGVLQDWRRFKQLEAEKKTEQDTERLALAKKLSLTCRSHKEDEEEALKDQQFMEDIDKLEDEFLKEYRKRRIEEMRRELETIPKFGAVVSLTKANFVHAIDSEKSGVTVLVHIYEDKIQGCEALNGCFHCLSQEYPEVKFCKIKASEAALSFKFAESGLPALLIYKSSELIGNFIRISDELGDDFFATDLECYLLEHGMLPDKNFLSSIRSASTTVKQDSDSDFDID